MIKKRWHWKSETDLPKLKKIKTDWDLNGLYYRNGKDPQIEEDLKQAEKAYAGFAAKWSKLNMAENREGLLKALHDYEKLAGLSLASKPGRYFSFRKCLNSNDIEANKQLALISERLRKASDQIIFFTLALGKLPHDIQKDYLSDPEFEHFRYFLTRIFEESKHDLSEAEEKIIRLKSRTSSSMWYEAVEKILSNRSVVFRSKSMPIPEALETIDLLKTKDKLKLWDLIIAEMEKVGEMAEHELNAIVSDARGEDELRGYKKPYSATALAYEDTESSIEKLVEAVSTRGFELSKKFYKLKARYHGLKTLHYTQKYESIGKDLELPFEQAVEICRDVFYGLKKEYGEIFDGMLSKGQIDVFPRKGKRGGAFMSDETGHPVHVFLNHVSNFKSLETLAHEMGHAIHAHRSATNTPLYDGHSIITAETASTLFENLVFDAVLKQATEKDKRTLLHDKITRDIATIQRQIAFFNCELEMHNTIKSNGFMSNAELADCMYRHLKSYLGSAVALDKKDGYSYVYIPHLRYGFYVYSYAYGILMSSIMADNYQKDAGFIEKIDQFLSAGKSDNVFNIFASIGINTNRENTFLHALDKQAGEIAEFEKLVKTVKLAK